MAIIAEQWTVDDRVQLDVQRAVGWRRLTGLIGRRELAACTALRFARCRSVHGVGMRRAIDVVFLDRGGRVTSVRRLDPWRFVGDRGAAEVLELRRGEALRLGITAGSSLKKQSTGGGNEGPPDP